MRKRILLVDDDATVVRIVSKVLGQDFDVSAYLQGDQALEALRHDMFDAVVSDMDMGAMSGVDFYRQAIKIRPELAKRFVFHTDALNPPIVGVPLVRKPANATVLRDKVHSLLS
jgi:CheY-like chemotaxis protein